MATKSTPPKKSKKSPRIKEDSLEDNSIESSLSLNYGSDFPIKKPFHFNPKHLEFYNKIKDAKSNMIMVDGAAGTGKSYIAVLAALEMFKDKKTKEIIYIRSVIESASRSIGALPGEIDDKFSPYAMPLLEKVKEISGSTTASQLKSLGVLNAIPVNFVRGLTFNDSVVIVDEAQNLTIGELVTIITRVGKNSKYILCGDLKQSDIGKASGYGEIFRKFNSDVSAEHGIHTIKFGHSEIVRSKILKFIIEVLESKS